MEEEEELEEEHAVKKPRDIAKKIKARALHRSHAC